MDPEGWYTEGPLRVQEASLKDHKSNLDLTVRIPVSSGQIAMLIVDGPISL